MSKAKTSSEARSSKSRNEECDSGVNILVTSLYMRGEVIYGYLAINQKQIVKAETSSEHGLNQGTARKRAVREGISWADTEYDSVEIHERKNGANLALSIGNLDLDCEVSMGGDVQEHNLFK